MIMRRSLLCNHQFVGVNTESSRIGEGRLEALGHHRTFECHLQRGRRTFVSTAANSSYLPTVISSAVSLVTHVLLVLLKEFQSHAGSK